MPAMKKPIALSLSLIILLGVSSCSAFEPRSGSSSISQASLDPALEERRIAGEKTLESLYNVSESKELDQFLQDIYKGHDWTTPGIAPGNDFVISEDAFNKSVELMNIVDSQAVLDETLIATTQGMNRIGGSENTIEDYVLLRKIWVFSHNVPLLKVSPAIFPGVAPNDDGEYVLSGATVYLKDENGGITEGAHINAFLSKDGKQVTYTEKNLQKETGNSYDAELFATYLAAKDKINNSENFLDELNKIGEPNGTRYELVKRGGENYIKVTDPRSILASNGELLYNTSYLKYA